MFNVFVNKYCFFALLSLFISPQLFAYQIQPMLVEIESLGNNTSITFRAANPDAFDIPVEVLVYKRLLDHENKETLVPAEDDFLIFPPQAEIPANDFQVFRAKYIGEPNLLQTVAYRVVFKQLPVEDKSQKSKVNVVFNLATLVFVSPPKSLGKSDTDLYCITSENCLLTVTNTGNGLVQLKDSQLLLTLKDKSEVLLGWKELARFMPYTYLVPQQTVSFELNKLPNVLQEVIKGKLIFLNEK